MQVMPVILVAVVMAVAGGLRPLGADWGTPDWAVALLALGPVVLSVAFASATVWWCGRRISRKRGLRAVLAADRIMRILRWLLVFNHMMAVLVFNWLGVVRHWVGNPVLLDELLAVLPPLVGWIGLCWANYPLERRLHDSLIIRHLDEGRPLYPVLSRPAHVWQQVRLHLLLLLVPTLMIVALSEAFQDLSRAWIGGESGAVIGQAGAVLVAIGVFVMAPIFAQWLLNVRPFAPGTLREELLDVCRRHRVRIRELLVWDTNGTIINAAVMGLVGRLRYVIMTDHLLETLRHDQVLAVMAHEIGHVRRHHMPWLVVCLMATFTIAGWSVEMLLRGVEPQEGFSRPEINDWIGVGSSVVSVALGLWMFGWVCRRFERQADTFAVQHLSGLAVPADAADGAVRPEAVDAMRSALSAIARLNTIDPHRPSWRHGSIAWRMEYLRSIVGQPVGRLRIDRIVRRLKLTAAVVVTIAIGLEFLQAGVDPRESPEPVQGSLPRPQRPLPALLGSAHTIHATESARP